MRKQLKLNKRRQMLPLWIKFFCWFFFILGFLTLLWLILLILFKKETDLEFYGINANDSFFTALIVVLVCFLHSITAYFLWFQKKNAIYLAEFNSIVGILICLLTMFNDLFKGIFIFRIELIFLIVFLLYMKKIKNKWENIDQLDE